ncbi:MAG: hypothetical protein GPJ54_01860 [Candidatus Heimdallarchaeota archaeon]|nr:hypothetical protein [Candidatus Heimdallarchaeota archaeon]
MSDHRFSRHIGLFSEKGQKKVETQTVGIVGLGGLGSHIIQGLVYLGVKDFVLIDDDIIELSNLNRLIGGTIQDIQLGSYKVNIATRLINSVSPDANISSHISKLQTKDAIIALSKCTIIFGCVDNDGARQILMELSAANNLIYFDLGTEIHIDEDYLDYGGRMVISIPGEYCLVCANEIDLERAKYDLLPKEYQDISEKHGYGLGVEGKAPSVAFLNGILANLAIGEFLALVANIREPVVHLRYYGERVRINRREVSQNPDCYTCNFITKQGLGYDLMRYTKLKGDVL